MAITWSSIDDAISRIFSDPNYGTYPMEIRMDAVNWGLSTLAWFHPVENQIAFPIATREIGFPNNFIEVVALWDGASWCQPVNFGTDNLGSIVTPGADSAYDRSFWIYGKKILLTSALTAAGILYYHAHYPKVTSINDSIDIPQHLFQPLLYFTICGILSSKIAQQGAFSMWAEEIEPGLTSDRLVDTYNFYWNASIEILKTIPMKYEELSLITMRRREYVQK